MVTHLCVHGHSLLDHPLFTFLATVCAFTALSKSPWNYDSSIPVQRMGLFKRISLVGMNGYFSGAHNITLLRETAFGCALAYTPSLVD